MNTSILLIIAINATILLAISWLLGGYFINSLIKERDALKKSLRSPNKPLTENNAENITPNTAPIEGDDLSSLLAEMAKDIEEKEDRIKRLLSLKNNQQTSKNHLQTLDPNPEMASYLMQLEQDFEETSSIILSLQNELDLSRISMANMENGNYSNQGQQACIAALEKSEINMRNENKQLRSTGLQFAETLDGRNKQIKRLQDNIKKLKQSIASLSTASQEQLNVIKKLHDQINRAEQLESHQNKLISELEKKLHSEKGGSNDIAKVDEMEKELENLRDTLKRTLIEKEFIEEHMLELDDSLEKARETEAALARSQEKMSSLEEKFPEYTPEPASESHINKDNENDSSHSLAIPTDRPEFITEIPELNNIIENNIVFGSTQEFWMTLDLPPLNMTDPQVISEMKHWVYITIGNDDYAVIMTIDEELATIISSALFKSSGNDKHGPSSDNNAAIEELGHIIVSTLATELDTNLSIGAPQHIPHPEAVAYLSNSAVVSEAYLSSRQKFAYAGFIIPDKNVSTSDS